MKKYNGLAALVVSTALVGCASQPFTNALSMRGGEESYTFKEIAVDEMQIGREFYIALKRNTNYDLKVDDFPVSAVKNQKLIPNSNSKIIRTPDFLKVVPKDEQYFFVNVYAPEDTGKLEINYSSTPRQMFVVLSKQKFPEYTSRCAIESMQKRIFEQVIRQAPYFEFEQEEGDKTIKDKLLKIPADNPFGPNSVFIQASTAKPLYISDTSRDGDKIVETTKFGLIGVVYSPMQATETNKLPAEFREELKAIGFEPAPQN